MEWKEFRLGEVCSKIGSGATPSGGKEAYKGGNYHLVRSQNVLDFGFSWEGLASINDEQAKKLQNVELQENDVLLNITGDSVARSCMIPNEVLPGRVNQHVAIIRADKRYLDCHYLLYYMQQQKPLLLQLASGGATRKAITKGMIEDLKILLPSLSQQKKIANILSSLDAKIENNNKINANLEAQAAALFKSWFVDFEPFRDGEFVESELGMIPKGWKVVELDSICSLISRGVAPKYKEGTNEWILGQTCVRNNIVTLNNAREHNPKSKTEKWIKQWDILINSTGIGSLGRVGIVYFDMDNVTYDTHLTVVRVNDSVYRHYIGRNLLNRQLEIENMAVGSTGQTELPRDSVKAMKILIPAKECLGRFNSLIEPMALTMYRQIIENKKLSQTRDTLLPKLMNGEIVI